MPARPEVDWMRAGPHCPSLMPGTSVHRCAPHTCVECQPRGNVPWNEQRTPSRERETSEQEAQSFPDVTTHGTLSHPRRFCTIHQWVYSRSGVEDERWCTRMERNSDFHCLRWPLCFAACTQLDRHERIGGALMISCLLARPACRSWAGWDACLFRVTVMHALEPRKL